MMTQSSSILGQLQRGRDECSLYSKKDHDQKQGDELSLSLFVSLFLLVKVETSKKTTCPELD